MNYKIFKDYIELIILFIIISTLILLIINYYNKTVNTFNTFINNKNRISKNKSKIENFNTPNIFIFKIFAIKKELLTKDEYKSEYENKTILEYCQNIINNQSNPDKKDMIINKVKTKINYNPENLEKNKIKLNFYDDDNIIYFVRINLNSSNTSADYNIKLNDSLINNDKINHNNTKNILEFTIDNNVIKYISKSSIELITNISDNNKPIPFLFNINKKYISVQNILGISENTNYLDPSIINEFNEYYKNEQLEQNKDINDIENRINLISKNLKIVI